MFYFHSNLIILLEMREAFNIFDKYYLKMNLTFQFKNLKIIKKYRDKSGSINARELKAVLKALDISATDREIRAVLKEMDTDGNNINI